MWKNMLESDKSQMTIWRKRTACWITKATNTLSEYVILFAFPLQQRLREPASVLRYTSIACLAVFTHGFSYSTEQRTGEDVWKRQWPTEEHSR